MDIKYIETLLHSFYEGETSLDEEKVLYTFFSEGDVPEDMLPEKRLFLQLYAEQPDVIPLHLEEKLNNLIDDLDAAEQQKIPRIALPNVSKAKSWTWGISIAASVLIILSIGIFTHFGNNEEKMLADTYSNPQDAYIETQKALLLVSNKLNKGIEQMEKVNHIIDKDVQL